MKATTIALSAFIGLVLGTNIALATSAHPPTRVTPSYQGVVTLDREIPAPTEITTLLETTITVPARKPTKSPIVAPKPEKVWTCSSHEMAMGTLGDLVKECNWK
jgi:hypothetical protein